MSNVEFLNEKVRIALDKVVRAYRKTERYTLTEQDLVIHSYEQLKKAKLSGFEVRAGLMPYRGEGDDREYVGVSKDRVYWKEGGDIRGAVFDLCVIRDDVKYWEEATSVRGKAEYWRFLSYPCKAFAAVIELKARVHGNLRRVVKDVRKLSFLSRVLDIPSFLVALDRCATEDDLSTIDAEVTPGSDVVTLYYCRRPTEAVV